MLDSNSKEILRNELGKRPIILSNKEDKIIWCTTKLGGYLVNVGCSVAQSDTTNKDWPTKFYSGKYILLYVRTFSWTILHKKILIGDRLYKRSTIGPYRCPLCKA